MQKFNQRLEENFPDVYEEGLLVADGFEAAFIGVGRQFNKPVAIYDREKCIDILITRDNMDFEQAEEYFEYNVQGAYVGEDTPIFMEKLPETNELH
ncbi:MAG: hypothetical protein CML19_04220 [Pusillimonas sp.]|jgi:hypothetical protein|nr:hypothetical protein [Pusillimonas sp.]|tara:strand:+ start:86 stop:373 length:288 start_codon:yes stop_codon:yes gene_type:complete